MVCSNYWGLTFTESLGFWELLIAKNQDIQKLLAFQGAFEKLFNVIESEGGVESRVNAESALTCVDSLLRFNSANQVARLIVRFIASAYRSK